MTKAIWISLIVGLCCMLSAGITAFNQTATTLPTSRFASASGPPKSQLVSMDFVVCDKFGTPVVGARARIEDLPEGTGTSQRAIYQVQSPTDANGHGVWGMVGVPRHAGTRFLIVASHPSIGEAQEKVEWAQIIHEDGPPASSNGSRPAFVRPVIKLRATSGPGFAAWREGAVKKARALVEGLVTTSGDKEVKAGIQGLRDLGILWMPDLEKAMENYDSPRRRLLVQILVETADLSREPQPLEKATEERARAMLAVHAFLRSCEWGGPPKPDLAGVKKMAAAQPDIVAKEIEWGLQDLRKRIAEEEAKRDPSEVQKLKDALRTATELLSDSSSMPSSREA